MDHVDVKRYLFFLFKSTHANHLRPNPLCPSLNAIVSFSHELPVEEAVEKMDLGVIETDQNQSEIMKQRASVSFICVLICFNPILVRL